MKKVVFLCFWDTKSYFAKPIDFGCLVANKKELLDAARWCRDMILNAPSDFCLGATSITRKMVPLSSPGLLSLDVTNFFVVA